MHAELLKAATSYSVWGFMRSESSHSMAPQSLWKRTREQAFVPRLVRQPILVGIH